MPLLVLARPASTSPPFTTPACPMTVPTDFRGSRQAAEALLEAIDPARYGATRNHLNGAVTRLSPYIRHGVLTLAEVRDRVLARGGGGKLIQELGWRDYWQRLWRQWAMASGSTANP